MSHLALLFGIGAVALVGLFTLARSGQRSAAMAARQVSYAGSLARRVLLLTVLIAGAQWLVIRFSHDPLMLFAAFTLPALLAAASIARAMTVPTLFGGRR